MTIEELGSIGELIAAIATVATLIYLAEVVTKVFSSQEVTESEKLRFEMIMIASFRRLESIYVQGSLGAIDTEFTDGFEKSIISMLRYPITKEWWVTAKEIFYPPFVEYVERRLESESVPRTQPAMSINQRSGT